MGDKIMEKEEFIIKSLFTLTIVITASVLILGAFNQDKTKNINPFELVINNLSSVVLPNVTSQMGGVVEKIDYTESSQCKVVSPVDSGNKTIILRMDDIAAYQYRGTSEKLVEDIIDRDMKITIGLIPKRLDRDKVLVDWLNEMKTNPNFEIALHGYLHTNNEFKNLNGQEASAALVEGSNIVVNNIGVKPITFIPPNNQYSGDSLDASKDLGFKVFSGDENDYFLSKDNEFVSLGYTSRTYEFDNKRFVPLDEVIGNCKKTLYEKDYCVVMLHPQDYLKKSPTGEIINEFDEYRYNEFQKMLGELEVLADEQDAEFKTFKDLVECH